MLKKYMFLAGLMMLAVPCAQAAVTIVSGSSGSNITNSDVAGSLGDIDIDDLSDSGSSKVPDVNYIQDEDGFFVDADDQAQMTEDEKEQAEKDKKAEEDKNKPVQIYRGAAANMPKLEAKRTHLMYEPTRY